MSETRHRGTSLAGGGYVVAMVDTPSFEGAAPAPAGLAGDLVLLHQSTPALLVQSMPFTPLLPAPLLPKPLLPKPLLPKPLLRGWSHVLAFVTIVAVGGVLIGQAAGTERGAVTMVVYVAGTATMFGVSSAYHRLRWRPDARTVMSKLDHCTIFLAIAGAYTPIAVVALHGWHQPCVLITVWTGTAIGITLQWIPYALPRWAFTAVYLVVGWAVAPFFGELYRGLGPGGFLFVLGGGVAYTAGAVIYAAKRPDPWPRVFGFHEVFHVFTVIGAGLHCAAMAFVVLPLL